MIAKPKKPRKQLHNAERQRQKREVADRSEGVCEVPTSYIRVGSKVTIYHCTVDADDCAHIIPKGRGYWRGVHSKENGIATCRMHHAFTETYEGRKACIIYLRERYGYDYSDSHYREYV